jgi:hypothetical protein
MTPKKLLLATSLAALAVIFISPPRAAAQASPLAAPPSAKAQAGPVAQITMDDGTGLTVNVRGRHPRPVLLRAGHRATILLQYDRSFAGIPLQVAALDGGKPSFLGNRNVLDPNGNVVVQFGDVQLPGLYRVSVNCGGLLSTLQFWVSNPDGSGGDASIQVPVPTSTSSR